ncbi:MAG: WG repeat-containing protein [Deltaproteobacteria bacterium]|nr:WG repeat-containing protein [Deltaproteobacteria bacterium]
MTGSRNFALFLLSLFGCVFLLTGSVWAQGAEGQTNGQAAEGNPAGAQDGDQAGEGDDLFSMPQTLPQPEPIVLPSAEGPLYPTRGPSGLFGYANAGGIMVIKDVFMAANPFLPDGTAWVNFENAYGQIDGQGRWAREPKLKFLRVSEFFPNGLAEAQAEGGGFGFIDAKGDWVVEPVYKRTRGFASDFGPPSDLAPVMTMDSKWGYVDAKGKVVIEPEYLEARPFAPNGLALVKNSENLYGYVDREGRLAILPRFAEARGFGPNGLAPVKEVGQELFGLIDQNGDMIVPPRFSKAAGASNNDLRAMADQDGLWGFVDRSGNFVIGPKYQRLGPFGARGLARFRLEDGTMGLLNQLDQWVLEPLYLFVGDFSSQGKTTEYTHAHAPDGLWGVINLSGEWEVSPRHVFCRYRLDGLVETANPESQPWDYLTLGGEPRVPLGYDQKLERPSPSPKTALGR